MSAPSETTKTAIRGVGWSFVEIAGSRLANLAVFVALARLLEPSAFGLMALAAVVITFIGALSEQGLGQALVQRAELEREHIDTVFWLSLGMGVGFAIALLVGAGPLAAAFHRPELAPVLRVLSIAVPIAALESVPLALLQRRLEFRRLAERQLIATVLSGIAGVAAAAYGLGVWSLVIQAVAQAALSTSVLWVKSRWIPRATVSRRHFKELFSFSLNFALMNLLNLVNRNADNLFIGAVLGPVALGLYSVGYSLLLLMTDVLMRTISAVAFPMFSRAQKDRGALLRGYCKATQLCAVVAVPSFMLVAVCAPDIVNVAFGPQWSHSAPVMQALAFMGALQSILWFNGIVISAIGKPAWAMKVTALNAVTNVIAFAIAVHWGIVAVAIAYTVRGYILAPLPILLSKRLLGFDWRTYFGLLSGPILATAVMSLATVALRSELSASLGPAALLAVLVPFAVGIYGLVIWQYRPELARDLRTFASAGMPDSWRRSANTRARVEGDMA
jgi:PST family polysaccharide transporter